MQCVAICGGTHGDERNGVYLGREFAKMQGPVGGADGFELVVVETNVEATKANKRYIEEDLNRCFTCKDLDDQTLTLYEQRRAKEINQLLGPKTSPTPKADFVLDLHNTTAATGVALFLHPRDKFAMGLAAFLQSIDPTVQVALWANRDVMLLPSVGRSGMTFEVGPVSIKCLDAKLYAQSKLLIEASLRYITAHNCARKRSVGEVVGERRRQSLRCFQMIRAVPFPRDDDKELLGMIHPAVDGKDFTALKGSDPVFSMFDGSEKKLQDMIEVTDDEVYPYLINEASYYEKDTAFLIGRRVEYDVEVLGAWSTTLRSW